MLFIGTFIDHYRLLFQPKDEKNFEPMMCLVEELWDDVRLPLTAQVAYVLASIKHETADTFLPVAELGKGRGKRYGQKQGPYDQIYYGRGYAQLTWYMNYEKQAKRLGKPVAEYPDLVMDPAIAYDILVYGMTTGMFTGKKLSDYINTKETDFIQARRVLNGTDKANLIADYAAKFSRCLRMSQDDKKQDCKFT